MEKEVNIRTLIILTKNNFYYLLYLSVLFSQITPTMRYNVRIADFYLGALTLWVILSKRDKIKNKKFYQIAYYILKVTGALIILVLAQVIFNHTFKIQYIKDMYSILYFMLSVILFLYLKPLLTDKTKLRLLHASFLTIISLVVILNKVIIPSERPRWPFENPNHSSSFIGILIIISILEIIPKKINNYELGSLAIGIFSLYLLNSLGTFLALAAVVSYYILSKSKIKKIKWILIALTVLSTFIFIYLSPRFEKSSEARIEIWRKILLNIYENPIFPNINYFFTQGEFRVYEAHNDLLDFALNYGIIGVFIPISIYIYIWGINSKAKYLIIYFMASGLTHSVFNYRWNWLFVAYYITQSTLEKQRIKIL